MSSEKILSADSYNAWTREETTLFSGHYLRNRSTLDIGVLGYIGILYPKEHPPEVWHIPLGTPVYMLHITVPKIAWTANNNTSYNNFTHPTDEKHAERDHVKKAAKKSSEAESLNIWRIQHTWRSAAVSASLCTFLSRSPLWLCCSVSVYYWRARKLLWYRLEDTVVRLQVITISHNLCHLNSCCGKLIARNYILLP
jgi:hypothetical protein